MNDLAFEFCGKTLVAQASGALWWPQQALLCVSDLHLGKSDRVARRTGALLPPYEVRDTLDRLRDDIHRTQAKHVVCLGDSFDDIAAADVVIDRFQDTLSSLMAGRDWTWIEGNHDPGPVALAGTHRAELQISGLTFRHIATPSGAEISGHYHPKARITARGKSITRPAFLFDDQRLILPAYGTYTGGLFSDVPVLSNLFGPEAKAILLGRTPTLFPMPRSAAAR